MPRLYEFPTTSDGLRDTHSHTALVTRDGNGLTTEDGEFPHQHQVVRFEVRRANGHTHEILEE